MARKTLRVRNEERRQDIKGAGTLLEVARKAHALPPDYLSVPELIRGIEELEVTEFLGFSDETLRDISMLLSWYRDMVNVLPDWRRDSREARDELEVLTEAAGPVRRYS